MKQLLISFFIIVATFGLRAETEEITAQDSSKVATSSNSVQLKDIIYQAQLEYQDGNFRKVIEILEAEIKEQKENGYVSPELYYNLGNAYFRMNEFADAILNYERAQLYAPGDRDITHNIEYTQTKIEDKILTADNFFLKIWFDGLQNLLPSNSWAIISIVFFLVFVACLFLFFFSPALKLKKAGFYIGIVLFVSLIFTNIFAFRQKGKIETRDTAIVMAGSAPVVSSPNTTSKELFILHSGTKVVITKTDGEWYEIEIANGSVGWVQKEKVEII
ncbi:MAG: SH3 domain-containing protein [Dysgonomonas sp.]|nr:SH3 domain-containing protein [Dysgonomonas sp.]